MAAVPLSQLSTVHVQELMCSYASLILADEDLPVTSDHIKKLIAAAGATVEPYYPGLFAQALSTVSVSDIVSSCGSAATASPGVCQAAASTGAAAPVEVKKEESEEEEEGDLGFSLFD
ncbi:60s acidic ribosomal protein P1 [Cryptosporidium andersoni]|uniref:60s acidic ribosomal protein P1 n=1 Tax=Cryptosporidium andersoni TaxID=117008 RepID=A0A1J4MVN3_9CRYT|nr:60s acidic ribosomal protein P1 [Cryptosporidium andersoni]